MATNTLHLRASDSNQTYPLRGDMSVSLDFIPDATFNVTFVTYSAESFTFTSTTSNFRQLDGTISDTLVIGGGISLFCTLMYNVTGSTWDIVAHNLTSAGGGLSPEVTATANANNEVTISKAQGNNYTINLTSNVKLLNPVGFEPGDRIRIVIHQDVVGARGITFDTLYAVPGAQPPVLSTGSNATDMLLIDATGDGIFLVTPYINAYSVVTPLARIHSTLYYKLGGPEGQGAFNKIKTGETAYIIRDGKGPEATATLLGPYSDDPKVVAPHFTVAGTPVNGGMRPTITMLPDTRPAYGKAVINVEGKVVAEIRDLRITGGRNEDSDCRGIAPNTYEQYVTVRNVEISNCNNGMLWGNDTFSGGVYIYDSLLDGNGIGGPSTDASHGNNSTGYVHNLYAGHNNASWSATRSTFQNSVTGHNLKSRALMATLDQVLAYNAQSGRELNLPNGGGVRATNCTFWKPGQGTQGNLIGIGEETVDTSRVREYTFRNCRFRNDVGGGGKDITFFITYDKQYPLRFIDCEFIGDAALALQVDPNNQAIYAGMVTVNGIRYYPECPPIFETTGGPLGPILPVGYFPVPMTPVGDN